MKSKQDAFLVLKYLALFFLADFIFLATSTSAFAQSTDDVWDFNHLSSAWVTESPAQTLQAQKSLFVVHASSSWDGTLSSQDGVKKIIQSTLSMNSKPGAETIPVLMLVDELRNWGKYFWHDKKNVQVVASVAGQHAIRLKNAKTVFVAGGVFEYCLCRTVRDIILNNDFSQTGSLNIAFVEDAIYVNTSYTDPRWSRTPVTVTLSSFVQPMTDTQFFAYVVSRYFGDKNTGLCTGLNERAYPGVNIPQSMNFEIIREGRRVGQVGNPKGIPLALHFISLVDYISNLH